MLLARFAHIALLIGLLWITAGCEAGRSSGDFVQIGSTKAGFLGPPAEYRAIHPRLADLFGKQVRFVAQPGGAGIEQQLKQGRIAYAFLSFGEYADMEDPTDLELIACGVNSAGTSVRKAILVAKADHEIKSIADCKGKRFAFGTYRDALTDYAVRAALEKGGVPIKDLFSELVLLTPPPIALEGRLYRGSNVGTPRF